MTTSKLKSKLDDLGHVSLSGKKGFVYIVILSGFRAMTRAHVCVESGGKKQHGHEGQMLP